MKLMFVPASVNEEIKLENGIDLLPENIGVITTTQYAEAIEPIIKKLENAGKKVFTSKGKQPLKAQILGCDASAAFGIADNVDAFLYIGTGEFHPLRVYMETKKKVFVLDPYKGVISELDYGKANNIEKQKKVALHKFLMADNVGVIVTLKPGQFNLKQAMELKEMYKDKNFYIFISDTIDYRQMDNFNFVQAWINTACPRIEDDISVLNIWDVPRK